VRATHTAGRLGDKRFSLPNTWDVSVQNETNNAQRQADLSVSRQQRVFVRNKKPNRKVNAKAQKSAVFRSPLPQNFDV
jgi:hypothetical protein